MKETSKSVFCMGSTVWVAFLKSDSQPFPRGINYKLYQNKYKY